MKHLWLKLICMLLTGALALGTVTMTVGCDDDAEIEVDD